MEFFVMSIVYGTMICTGADVGDRLTVHERK